MQAHNLNFHGERAAEGVLLAAGIPMRRASRVPPQIPVYLRAPVHAPAGMFPPTILVDSPFARENVRERRALRPYGIGWFGVFVAWLATTTLSIAVSATVPAHGGIRVRAGRPYSNALPAPAALAIPTPNVPATPVVSAAPPAAPTATALPTAPAPPLFRISELPRARPTAPAVVQHVAAAPATHVHAQPAEQPVVQAAAQPVVAEQPVQRAQATAPAVAEDDPPPRAIKVAPPAPPVVKAAPTATFAPGSLEDLIRKEVEKEQKGLHHK